MYQPKVNEAIIPKNDHSLEVELNKLRKPENFEILLIR